jgi:hypothetical protein
MKKMWRRIDRCLNCGEVRELAAHGLCFACYRRDARAQVRPELNVDRHSPGIRKEQKKLIKAFATLMGGLADLGVSKDDVLRVQAITAPYLITVLQYLQLEDQLNVQASEREPSTASVHRSLEAGQTAPEHDS